MKYRQYFFCVVGVVLLTRSCGRVSKPFVLQTQSYYEFRKASNLRPTPEIYQGMRDALLNYEYSRQLGASLKLNKKEYWANQIIMKAKTKEYKEGLAAPHLFAPAQHIFSVLEKIEKSELFKLLQQMPKGGVLHAHDTALCNTDFLIELTYRDYLWGCWNATEEKFVELMYSRNQPTTKLCDEAGSEWIQMEQLREYVGEKVINDTLRQQFTLYPKEKYLDNNHAWKRFIGIFNLLDGLLFYKQNWADYYYKALEEFSADGVQYLEFRSTLPILYDLEGNNYTELDTVAVYKKTLVRFMANHSDFIGSKLIYAPLRFVNETGMAHYIETCKKIKLEYPDFLAGFDLVGQEEMGGPLKDFVPQLLTMPDNINFLFHAGETNWFGSSVDENLIDAILLGTRRIGHGFALLKHPVILEQLKTLKIAVEVNPISNQVLQLITDHRNHPSSYLFADNYPVVVSSDDPSFWKATPLTHDFYIAFLGIASANSDLKFLKQLVLNSIKYSMLTDQQKKAALKKWQIKWNEFIENIIKGNQNNENNETLDANTMENVVEDHTNTFCRKV